MTQVKNPLSAVATPAACANDDCSITNGPPAITTTEMSPVSQVRLTYYGQSTCIDSSQFEADTVASGAPHVASVVPTEDVPATTLSSVDPSSRSMMDYPATPLLGGVPLSLVEPSAIPSFVADESMTTASSMTNHSATPLIGGAPLPLVDPSAIHPSVTDISMTVVNSATDRSATLPINVTHVNGGLNAELPMMSTTVSFSTTMSAMSGEEPVPVHNVSAASLMLSEPSPNPLIMKLNNPAASTTEILVDASADAPSDPPTSAPVHTSEKGPTGLTKKTGVMRPNPQSKTAR